MLASVKWFITSLTLVVCLSSSLCWGDDLFEEVKSGFADAESRLENCSLQARYRILAVKAGREIQQDAIFSIFQGKYFSNTLFDQKSGLETVQVANDKYVFVVTKQKDSDKYALVEFEPRHSDDNAKQKKVDAGIAGIRLRLFNTYTIGAVWPARDLVRESGFHVLSAERITQQGRSLVKIVYEAEPKRALNEIISSRPFGGYFVCDPASSWAITEQWIKGKEAAPHGSLRLVLPKRFDDDLAMSARYVVQYVAEGEIDAARTKLSGEAPPKSSQQHELVEILEAPEENQFFLSHYGLSEPQQNGFVGPWVWYLIVGLMFAGVGAYLLRRHQTA